MFLTVCGSALREIADQMRRERDAAQEQLQGMQAQRSSLTHDNHKLNLALQVDLSISLVCARGV